MYKPLDNEIANRRYSGLCVVVPTRNRADLAANAISSILASGRPDVSVIVSDNSSEESQKQELSAFCVSRREANLAYLTPPEPLSMTRHWDWAIAQAMTQTEASHISILTDRMCFLPGGLDGVVNVLRAHPDDVVVYNHDRIADFSYPIRLEQSPWTGRSFRVMAADLLQKSSQGKFYCPAFPRMLNSAVPTAFLERLRERFGTIFDSISPDYNFCFRCLALTDSVIYYDRSAILHYAQSRSNGGSFERGTPTPDHRDFLSLLAGPAVVFNTPLPQVPTVGNAIFHEYEVVRSETGDARFHAIDLGAYLRYLCRELSRMENEELRTTIAIALRERARADNIPFHPAIYHFIPPGARLGPMRLLEHAIWRIISAIQQKMRLHRSSYRSASTSKRASSGFQSAVEAIDYASRHPRWRSRTLAHLADCSPLQVVNSPKRGGDSHTERTIREA